MICYENRNGILAAIDTDTNLVIVPGGEDLRPHAAADANNVMDSEEIREELERRGVSEVFVYVGGNASWINGQVGGTGSRLQAFVTRSAKAYREQKVWKSVPVSRIGDGSDWGDIYAK